VVSRGLAANRSNVTELFSIKFNNVSETFLVTGTDGTGQLALLELNQYGSPLTAPMRVATRILFPIASSRSDVPEWRVVGTIDPRGGFDPSVLASEEIGTSMRGGGSAARLGGCVTPDPFTAFGGGVCFDGGWLPPGVLAPGTTITYSGRPSNHGMATTSCIS
jgi:hypothetical protein